MKITIDDIRTAMKDQRFRDGLSPEFAPDIDKFLKNPGCKCHNPLLIRIANKCPAHIKTYFPSKDLVPNELVELQKNSFKVINCHIDQLEVELKKLALGRKNIAMSRYEDQVTVIVNELDF